MFELEGVPASASSNSALQSLFIAAVEQVHLHVAFVSLPQQNSTFSFAAMWPRADAALALALGTQSKGGVANTTARLRCLRIYL